MPSPASLPSPAPSSPAELRLAHRDRLSATEDSLAALAMALTQATTEAAITDALRSAAQEIAPRAGLRLSSIHPDGWHTLLDDPGGEAVALAIPLRAGGALLGELAVLSSRPLSTLTIRRLAELGSHVALAMARLEFGRLITGYLPCSDGDAPHALRDVVTNLPSRMLYHDRLEHALHRRARSLHPVAVLRIHLAGGITAVYEGLGEAMGDELLIHVAKRLHRLVRPSDTLARLGDDEFAVILDDLDSAADAPLIAERLIEALNVPMVLGGQIPLSIQASIGVAVNTGAAESAIELLHKAETAMYSAKAAGNGCIEVHDHRFRMDTAGRRLRVAATA